MPYPLNIGIYGGTFNPIHLGHMEAARYAAHVLQLDRLYLVPDGIPPHKEMDEGSPDAKHRLEMVRLAAENLGLPPGVACASSMEQRRDGKSYTVDTVKAFHQSHPKDTLWLLMGTDMFLTFHRWRQPEEILSCCGLCAFGRTEADTEELFRAQREYLQEKYNARVTTIVLPNVVDISSTELRRRLAEERPGTVDCAGGKFLAPPVYGYILRSHLYGTSEDLKHLPLEKLRPVALSHLKGSRVPHVLGTEETAAALARRWGADEEEARRAALLHDCTKRLSKKEQLELCRAYKISLDAYEKREEKLLHAKTGAAVAKAVYGVSDAVYEAIFWHTTGKPGMTLLEKIMYLADYIEPTRDFCDLTQLRRLAFEDLDKALLLGLTMAVDDLRDQGMALHPNSVLARDDMKGRIK